MAVGSLYLATANLVVSQVYATANAALPIAQISPLSPLPTENASANPAPDAAAVATPLVVPTGQSTASTTTSPSIGEMVVSGQISLVLVGALLLGLLLTVGLLLTRN